MRTTKSLFFSNRRWFIFFLYSKNEVSLIGRWAKFLSILVAESFIFWHSFSSHTFDLHYLWNENLHELKFWSFFVNFSWGQQNRCFFRIDGGSFFFFIPKTKWVRTMSKILFHVGCWKFHFLAFFFFSHCWSSLSLERKSSRAEISFFFKRVNFSKLSKYLLRQNLGFSFSKNMNNLLCWINTFWKVFFLLMAWSKIFFRTAVCCSNVRRPCLSRSFSPKNVQSWKCLKC